MKCPFCGDDSSQVKDSRSTEDNSAIRRRRECQKCKQRFTTFERMESANLMITKRDNTRQIYDRDKLFRSMTISLRNNHITTDKINEILKNVENFLNDTAVKREVSSRTIGQAVLQQLKNVDFIAYVRYASVYHEFSKLEDFEELLYQLKKGSGNK
ncbi:MAG: transcriptional repressor NrdR [Proteobacteria bacterium]|nr:transcriptional repressor NrdR [Pseudomonadota bacterium]